MGHLNSKFIGYQKNGHFRNDISNILAISYFDKQSGNDNPQIPIKIPSIEVNQY